MEDLDCNPFYLILQNKYKRQYEEAQSVNACFLIPSSDSLDGIEITEDIIKLHIVKPSPYFKGEFVNFFYGDQKMVEIEGTAIKKVTGFDDSGCINILSEEKGYTKNGKSFSIFVVDNLLTSTNKKKAASKKEELELEIPQSWLDGSSTATLTECKRILQNLSNGKILSGLEEKTNIILKNYLFLPNYLEEASQKLKGLADNTVMEALTESSLEMRLGTVLRTLVENYMMNCLHSRLFPVICQKFSVADGWLRNKLLDIYALDIIPTDLGADEAFSCRFPASVVELARLDSLPSPREKIQCVKNTIDLIAAELKQHILETRGLLSPSSGLSTLTTDNLIPVLLTVIIRARLFHLEADIFYIENFLWSISSKDALGYSFVTFKAAVEFLKTTDVSRLAPSRNHIKKELSPDELMEATVKLELKAANSVSENNAPESEWTPVDRQMERITKMIEASTRELSSVQHYGTDRCFLK